MKYGSNGNTLRIDGDQVHGRFGYSLASLDFNLDGISDLAVGLPTSGDTFTSLTTLTRLSTSQAKFTFILARGVKD